MIFEEIHVAESEENQIKHVNRAMGNKSHDY